MAPLIGAALISGASSLIGGGMSMFGGRRQQAAANAQAAAQMQFERENMFHQNQVAFDMMREQHALNSAEAGIARDWNADQADIARRWNAGQAQEARDWNATQFGIERTFNAQEAEKNRAFQQEMSNTQYQRAVKDMQAAGLNPMLAVSQGGAGNVSGSAASASAGSSAPASMGAAQGAQASGGGASPAGLARGAQAQQFNYLASGIATAAQVGQMVAGVHQMNAQTEKTKAETEVALWEADVARARREGGYSAAKIGRSRDLKESAGAAREEQEAWTADERRKQAVKETEYKGLEEPGHRAKAEYEQLMLEMLKGGGSSAGAIERGIRLLIPFLLKGLAQ